MHARCAIFFFSPSESGFFVKTPREGVPAVPRQKKPLLEKKRGDLAEGRYKRHFQGCLAIRYLGKRKKKKQFLVRPGTWGFLGEWQCHEQSAVNDMHATDSVQHA